jgi:hypothetical protein
MRRVSLCIVFALVALSPSAYADATITLGTTTFTRLDKNGNFMVKRQLAHHPEGINFEDCVEEQQIEIPLVLTGFEAGGSAQAWASETGVDCSVASNRSGPCWSVVADVPLAPTVEVKVPVRALVARNAPSACRDGIAARRTIQFLYFSPTDPTTAAASNSVSFDVDTALPAAPTGLALHEGDGRLLATWDPDPTVSTFALFCDACGSIDLANHPCGVTTGSAGSTIRVAYTNALDNGRSYAVAVAAVDDYENVGPLSSPVCATPQPSSGTETNRCSFAIPRSEPASIVLVLGVGLFLRVRRARRADASSVNMRGRKQERS